MPDHNYLANLIRQIADLLRGPYRPPQYERVMLAMTVLRRFDCVLMSTMTRVLAERERRRGGRLNDDALDRILNNAAGQRFHNQWTATETRWDTRLTSTAISTAIRSCGCWKRSTQS
jgi:type I restriction enzyme M protein